MFSLKTAGLDYAFVATFRSAFFLTTIVLHINFEEVDAMFLPEKKHRPPPSHKVKWSFPNLNTCWTNDIYSIEDEIWSLECKFLNNTRDRP